MNKMVLVAHRKLVLVLSGFGASIPSFGGQQLVLALGASVVPVGEAGTSDHCSLSSPRFTSTSRAASTGHLRCSWARPMTWPLTCGPWAASWWRCTLESPSSVAPMRCAPEEGVCSG